jgi:hypothetical protein
MHSMLLSLKKVIIQGEIDLHQNIKTLISSDHLWKSKLSSAMHFYGYSCFNLLEVPHLFFILYIFFELRVC